MRFVRQNATQYKINPAYLGGVGGSSGAHLVSLMGTLDGAGNPKDPDPANRQSAALQCIIARAAPLDLLQMTPSNISDALGLFWDYGSSVRLQRLEPLHIRRHGPRPQSITSRQMRRRFCWCMVMPTNQYPSEQSEIMAEALRKVNVPVKLIRIPNGGHGPAFAGGQMPADLNTGIVTWLDVHLRKTIATR